MMFKSKIDLWFHLTVIICLCVSARVFVSYFQNKTTALLIAMYTRFRVLLCAPSNPA